MAGLGVVLETQNPFPKCPQVISKTSLITRRKSFSSHHTQPSPFLEHCYLCHQRLCEGKDIYMYRGDRAFCSEECRCKQIFMDEDGVNRDSCSMAAAGVRRQKSRPVADGFA